MKKVKFISVAMAAIFALSLAPVVANAADDISIINPNNSRGTVDPRGYWSGGLYYPNGYWYDNTYYSYDKNVGYWKDGIFYSYGDTSNNIKVIPYYGSSQTVVTGPGYWRDGVFYPYTYSYRTGEGYWKDGVYYPSGNSSNTGSSVNYGNFYPYAYYPGSSYPYGYTPYTYYTPGYYNPTAYSTLGGVTVPNNLLTQAAVNNKNIGFSMRGTTVNYAQSTTAPISGQTAVTLDFSESIGRAYDQSLVLTLAVAGSSVAEKDQQAVMLNGYIKHFEAAKEQGIESIAIADKGRNIIATLRINDSFIKNLKQAYQDNGASVDADRFILQTTPIPSEKIPSDIATALGRVKANSELYSVNAFIVKDNKKIDISDQLGKVNLRVKANSQDRSLLCYYNGSKFELTGNGSFVLDQGSNQTSALGDVPIGSTVVIARVKT